jgi:predicted HTH domain antitoxin
VVQLLLREAVAIALCERDRVSLRPTREIAGMDRRQFEAMLGSRQPAA